jgi:hypothetical protein
MTREEIKKDIPKIRIGALGMKEFYKLSQLEKNNYIQFLLSLEPEALGDCDTHILRFHTVQPERHVEHFISMED